MSLRGILHLEDAVRQLNQTMADGIDVVSFRQIQDEKKYSGMTLVVAADYLIVPKDMEETALREHNSVTPVFPDNWNEALAAFLEQPEIKVMKKTKRSEKEVDIRPMIYDMEHIEPSGICTCSLRREVKNNLKPDLVMDDISMTRCRA